MTDSEFFDIVCQWKGGNCRNGRLKGEQFACCNKYVCPNICPLGKIYPDRCKNPPDICKYYLCNEAKIYIMKHPELHEHYIKLLKEASNKGIEYNNCIS